MHAQSISDDAQLLTQWFGRAMHAMRPDMRVQQVLEETWPLGVRSLDNYPAIWVFGVGKGAVGLATGVVRWLGGRCSGGAVLGQSALIKEYAQEGNLSWLSADHPIPGRHSVASTTVLLEKARQVGSEDLVFFVLTGGASAMLCSPELGITLDQKQNLHHALLRSGASIAQMNTVRKHTSAVKGGKMLYRFNGARIINLLISDVPGDDPATIGSGPTNPDPSTCSDMRSILHAYLPEFDIPPSWEHLPETPKPGDKSLPPYQNIWVATPYQNALEIADMANKAGFVVQLSDQAYAGPLQTVAHRMIEELETASADCAADLQERPRLCIWFGESQIRVTGEGHGGRNQHLALMLSESLARIATRHNLRVTLLSAGTDGIDGNTGHAGAICDHRTAFLATENNLSATTYLQNFDSGTFFSQLGLIFAPGPTGNNLMDLQMALISKQPDGAGVQTSAETQQTKLEHL